MSKVLVITGGCGFIGTNIALKAREKEYKVIVFDSLIRSHTDENAALLKKRGVQVIVGDICNPHDIKKLPKNVTGIIHLAGNPGVRVSIEDPEFDFLNNALGTLRMLEFARLNGNIPFIFASTNKIYSEEINLVSVTENLKRYEWDFKNIAGLRASITEGVSKYGINEHFPMDNAGFSAHSPYGVSKITGDLYCQEYFHLYNVPTVVNRMSCIYGLFQKGVEDQGWIDWFLRVRLQNLPLHIYGNGKQVRDVLFGEDVAELYLKELENIDEVKGEVFNVGGGIKNTVSLLEAIELIEEKTKGKFTITYMPTRPVDQRIYISDIRKVGKKLDWKPKVSFEDGLDKMIKQYNRLP